MEPAAGVDNSTYLLVGNDKRSFARQIIPNFQQIVVCPTRTRRCAISTLARAFPRSPQQIFDIQLSTFAGIELSNPNLKIGAKGVELVDVLDQLLTDAFLRRFRQRGRFFEGQF